MNATRKDNDPNNRKYLNIQIAHDGSQVDQGGANATNDMNSMDSGGNQNRETMQQSRRNRNNRRRRNRKPNNKTSIARKSGIVSNP